MPASLGNIWISNVSILWGGVRTLGNSRISLGSWYFKWLLVRTVSMNFIMETKFQLKCHLQHGSDPPTVAGLQLAGWCSAVTLSFMFVEGSAFVLFLSFIFRFPSILLKLSLVDSSLDTGRTCPFSSSLRISIPKTTTLFLCLFHVKNSGFLCNISTTMCSSSVSYPYIHLQLSDLSQTLWKPMEVRVIRTICFRTSLVDIFIYLWFIHAGSPCLHLILAFHLSYSSLVMYKGEFAHRQRINKWLFAFLVLEGRMVLFKFK